MSKFLRNPASLTVAEMKTMLRASGKSVSGKKAELLDRLMEDDADDFDMDGEGNRLPLRDMAPGVSHQLRIIPFDGQDRDPASLIGHRIQRYQIAMGEGLVLHTDRGRFTMTFLGEMAFSRYADIMVGDALLEGLKPVEQVVGVLFRGDKDITRAEREMEAKKGRNLLIVEAAVGMRKCPDQDEYRVVGIRCEGMEKMGFVFAEDQELEDYYGRNPRFGDVGLVDSSESWEARQDARHEAATSSASKA